MDKFLRFLEIQRQRYTSFEQFRAHVEKILTSRKQRKADYTRLDESYLSAGVLFNLMVPLSLSNGGLQSGQNILDHIYILFEKRSEDLSKHPGQLSFPGGTKEEQDTNLVETALREAEEEVGINPEEPEFVSYLDEFVSSTRILVKPVITWHFKEFHTDQFIEQAKSLYKPRTKETVNTIILPLTHLLNPENYHSEKYYIEHQHVGWVRYFDVHSYLPNDHVWGLTASMLRRFIDEIFPDNLLPEEPVPSYS